MDHLLLLLLLWSSGLGGGGRLASAAAQCEAVKADIVMLVDESGSIGQENFRKMLQFVGDIIKKFTIGPDAVQIGLTLFSNTPRTIWHLNTHQTKESLLEAVDRLEPMYGGSNTGLALKRILHDSFKPNMEMRPDSRKIVVVLTDGESHDDVEEPAKHLRDTDIEVYTIGIRDASKPELLKMATDEAHVYFVEDFSSLPGIEDSFSISLCNNETSRAVQCEAAKADIVMLLDESGSMSRWNFWDLQQFLKEIIKLFTIGPDAVQIGLTLFSDTPSTIWHLNTNQTKESLLEAVDRLELRGGGTNTGLALKHILHDSFKPNMGMRPDSRKIVVVLTDGESYDNVEEPAKHLRDTGIEVYAIGIRDAFKLDLLKMATDEAHVYFVEGFRSLPGIEDSLSTSLCNSATSRDSVRLVNGSSLCSGRLEVRSNQSNQFNRFNQSLQGWSSVCEADFDLQDAEVVCRELGCGAPWVLQGALYGEVEAPWWSREFQCGGRESALMDCRSSASDRNTCSPGRAAGLTCSEPLRLVGGASRCAGVLQVKLVEWRTVDGSDWSLKAAAAACTELHCGSAVLTASSNQSSESPGWSVDRRCVEAGWRLRECSTSTRSSSTVELVCSDLLEQPVISVSSVGGVYLAQQQGFQVSWRSSFTLSCSIQPQYPGGSFQLSFTSSSNTTLSHTQPAVNHSARFTFPVAGPAHQGGYTCVYHVHVFSRNFSSESRRLSLVVSDPTVFFIRLTLLLLSLLIFTSLICFSHKIARKYERRTQEDVEVEQQTRRRRRILQVEQQI